MQEFIHNKVKTIELLFEDFNKVQGLFSERSFDFDLKFNTFLDQLLNYYRERGDQSQESEVLKMINQLLTVRKGFDPIRMEKVDRGRRELMWGFSYSTIEQVHHMLSTMYQKEKIKLDEGEELISNLVLSLYQNQILTDSKIKKLNTIAKIEVFWDQMVKQNTSISSLDKKLKMSLITEDIYLLFEKVISKMN